MSVIIITSTRYSTKTHSNNILNIHRISTLSFMQLDKINSTQIVAPMIVQVHVYRKYSAISTKHPCSLHRIFQIRESIGSPSSLMLVKNLHNIDTKAIILAMRYSYGSDRGTLRHTHKPFTMSQQCSTSHFF